MPNDDVLHQSSCPACDSSLANTWDCTPFISGTIFPCPYCSATLSIYSGFGGDLYIEAKEEDVFRDVE
jgi:hypothetical protein